MKLLPDLPEMKKRRSTLLVAMLILSAIFVTACAPVPSMPVVMAQATGNDAADDADSNAENPHNMEIDGVAVDHATMHAQMVAESAEPPPAPLPGDALPATPLTMPGNDAFGAIQEVTAMLLANPDTDWHSVNLEALRVHLADMENMTLRVDVVEQSPTPDGVRLVVEPQDARVMDSLRRVLAVHPAQLAVETGWTMLVLEENGRFILTIETENPDEIEMIRGLGYIGTMSIGNHHKIHHWMIATGANPHE